jgi:hypothetical protein
MSPPPPANTPSPPAAGAAPAAERLDAFTGWAVAGGLLLAALTFLYSAWFLSGLRDQLAVSPAEWVTLLRGANLSDAQLDLLLMDRAFQLIVLVRISKSLGGLALTFVGVALLVLGIRQPVDAKFDSGQAWRAKGAGLSPGLIALLAGAYLMATAPDGLSWERAPTRSAATAGTLAGVPDLGAPPLPDPPAAGTLAGLPDLGGPPPSDAPPADRPAGADPATTGR